MSKVIVAPSVLAADFRNLEKEFKKINESSAEWIHFDVMDGVNVPNISFGFPILEAVRSLTDKFIDIHLMIEAPARYFEMFKRYGADGLTIHYEGNQNLSNDLSVLRELDLNVGLVINPSTSVDVVIPYLTQLDLILLMAVEPGFGGQKFIESTVDKVKQLKDILVAYNSDIKIQVDGGVSVQNAKLLREAGADVLVCGSALFRADSFAYYINSLLENN